MSVTEKKINMQKNDVFIHHRHIHLQFTVSSVAPKYHSKQIFSKDIQKTLRVLP